LALWDFENDAKGNVAKRRRIVRKFDMYVGIGRQGATFLMKDF